VALSEAALQRQLDELAAEVYPLTDAAFATLSEDGRWRHWCARRDAARAA
jgi:hypothetical protein